MAKLSGGKRKDRAFIIRVVLPPETHEDEFMDYAEMAVCEFKNTIMGAKFEHIKFFVDTVTVKRKTPPYGEQK